MPIELHDCIYMTLPHLEITLLKLGDLMQVLKYFIYLIFFNLFEYFFCLYFKWV